MGFGREVHDCVGLGDECVQKCRVDQVTFDQPNLVLDRPQ
jgi:hypothetical protein